MNPRNEPWQVIIHRPISTLNIQRRIRKAFLAGTHLDLAGQSAIQNVPADLIAKLLLSKPFTLPGSVARLDLANAYIIGKLNLANAHISVPLILQSCKFSDPIDMRGTSLQWLELRECEVPSLEAKHLEVAGDAVLSGISSEFINLSGAHVAHDLHMCDARLQHPRQQVALDARGIRIEGDLDCQRLLVSGSVTLTGAHVCGSAKFEHAKFSCSNGCLGNTALDADAIIVEQGFAASGMVAQGHVSLIDMRCETSLEFSGARFTRTNPDDVAITMDRCEIKGSVYCDENFYTMGSTLLYGGRFLWRIRTSTATSISAVPDYPRILVPL